MRNSAHQSNKRLIRRTPRSSPVLPALIIAVVVLTGGYLFHHYSRAAGLTGDLNNDGTVNVFDLSILLSDWATGNATADINHDGTVNIFDLSTLLSNWGQAATVTPTPTAGATDTPAPTSTPSVAYTCVQTAGQDNCTYPSDQYFSGNSGDPYLNQNIWSNNPAYHQTLYGASPENWYITANVNTGFGGVQAYPNVGWNMDGTVDSKASTTSSWDVTIPTDTTKVAGWAAYDLWFNDWNDEVMVQTDIVANSDYDCNGVATITVSGTPWHMCDFGSERVWKPGTDDQHLQNRTTGSVDIKAFLTWMEQNGKLPPNSTWTAGSFGFEVCDTESTTQTFKVNGFSWHSP